MKYWMLSLKVTERLPHMAAMSVSYTHLFVWLLKKEGGIVMKNLVVLTGAGMSAESGISTFRDAGGLWDKYCLLYTSFSKLLYWSCLSVPISVGIPIGKWQGDLRMVPNYWQQYWLPVGK